LGGVLVEDVQVEAINLGGAAITALVILKKKEVLVSLDIVSNEGNIDMELPS
jgi:hypothetical protein